jgi:hypothetical protein
VAGVKPTAAANQIYEKGLGQNPTAQGGFFYPRRRPVRTGMPGGGGYGDPRKRPAVKVADDVVRGLVSAEKARELHGVALTADLKVDEAETATLRTQMVAK